jgi:hypothetical protein
MTQYQQKKNKKKTFSNESIAEQNAVRTNKKNKTQYTKERTITDKSSEQIINESESESENELNN